MHTQQAPIGRRVLSHVYCADAPTLPGALGARVWLRPHAKPEQVPTVAALLVDKHLYISIQGHMMGNKVDYTGWSKKNLEKELGKLSREELNLNSDIETQSIHSNERTIFGQLSKIYNNFQTLKLRQIRQKSKEIQDAIDRKKKKPRLTEQSFALRF